MGRFDSFVALKNFLQGKIDGWALKDADERINQISVSKDRPSSLIYYNMGTFEDLFKLIGLNEEDIWTYNSVTSNYGGGSIYGEDVSREDFDLGYGLWDELDAENFEKLQLISQYIMKEPFENDVNFLEKFAEVLEKLFPKQTRNMVAEFAYERNKAMKENAEEVIEKELDEYFDELGVNYTSDGVISFTVKSLFDKYLDMATPHYPIYKVLKEMFQDSPTSIGGWSDTFWESDWSENFDEEEFNRQVERELDSIIETLEDDEGKAKDFINLIQRVTSKHPQGYWRHLPKDSTKTVEYSVRGFDYPSQTIIVKLRKGLQQKEFKMKEENFNNLLYQPELFKIGELHNF
jgi:hypothetical protein